MPGKILQQFKLNGKVITIRYPKPGDAASAMALINETIDENVPMLRITKTKPEEEPLWRDNLIKSQESGMKIHLIIDADGVTVGQVALARQMKPPSRIDHTAEFGATIKKEYRNRGIGTRAAKILFKLAREKWKLKLAVSTFLSVNLAAAGFSKKLGFKIAGRIPKGTKFGGKYCDSIITVKNLT
ncbi:MAG: GNAT family protein [Planctomycetota bacterium]